MLLFLSSSVFICVHLWLLLLQLVHLGRGYPQFGDLLLLCLDQRVELRDLAGVLALLVLAEAEQVGDVLRPPAVEVQLVLLEDRLAQLLELVVLRAARDRHAPRPVLPAGGGQYLTPRAQLPFPREQPEDGEGPRALREMV